MGTKGDLTRKEFLGALAAAALMPKAALAKAIEPVEKPIWGLELGDLVGAERTAAIKLTDKQRKLALGGAQSNIQGFVSIRDLRMGNEIEPNLVFTPKGRQPKPGTTMSIKTNKAVLPTKISVDDLAFMSVVELGIAVKSKQISPVELTELYLKRLDQYGDKLKCVITHTPELARKQAKQAESEIMSGDYKGYLHGIPYGIKDLFSVKGYRTTWGAEAFKNQFINYDSAVVGKLNHAGAICVAKLSCGALAYDDVWFGGKTLNPWNTKQGSSGSSAGPACATAAGLVAFSIGTETLGSIISPSNRCRVTGLRPTYGRVSRFGGMVLTWTMDKVGPICRTAEDCGVVLGHLVGADSRDLATVDRPYLYNSNFNIKKLKIGVITGEKESPIETEDWANSLSKMGCKLEPVKFSSPPQGIWSLLVAEAAAFFDELTLSEGIDKIGNLWPAEFLAARYMPAVEYINAHRARSIMAAQFEKELADYDMIITDHFWDDTFTTCNGTGHPQVIIPWGLDKAGNPRSISIIGRLYDEASIAAVAHQLQQTQQFHKLRPF